ncbi:uncharacterized protein PAC_01407 [Phialocephala subalpina]|uniref:C2H2-type domain-containing protein n=1 Tax=Phialocephala subalpina TaxID=576137 RepID=A0A1L7WFI0_9HELO|nr:uncharacterized protein PAC_01407 [Phialocephala subalpina]
MTEDTSGMKDGFSSWTTPENTSLNGLDIATMDPPLALVAATNPRLTTVVDSVDADREIHLPSLSSWPSPDEVGPYRCDLCSNSYFRAEHITRHRKIHHVGAEKKYYCSNCPSSFDGSLAFSLHVRWCRPSKGDGSLQNTRGGVYSRRGSVHSGASTGYEEIVFDSKSAHSGSQASIGSANSVGSGRRGPLSRLARAGMNAVKEVGACWRCKFLKKSCDPHSPCALCPNDSKSMWGSVGCKRGNFHLPSFRLCRRPFAKLSEDHPDAQAIESKIMSLNLANNPDLWTQKDSLDSSPAQSKQIKSDEVNVRQQFYENLDSSAIAERSPATSAQLLPLEQCALAILWNFTQFPSARQILNEKGSLDDLVRLLPYAVAHQAERQENQLIAQSLICLRTCAEALRVKAAGLLGTRWHSSCESQKCKIECIANLSMHIELYIRELSRVFFKKENAKRRHPWWLSTFYSFCIQSYVRRALVELAKGIQKTEGPDVDICTVYEEAVWQVGQRDKATDEAPTQLAAVYALFCHGIQKEYLGKNNTFFGRAAERWRGLSPVKREWSLRQALLMSVSYLDDKLSKYSQARNPLKSSLSEFTPMLIHTKLSPEMIADLHPKFTATKDAEADLYLYLPVRLFIALNSETCIDDVARIPGVQPSWEANGIRSPSDYLKSLFQDDGRALDEQYSTEELDGNSESSLQPSDANREGRCSPGVSNLKRKRSPVRQLDDDDLPPFALDDDIPESRRFAPPRPASVFKSPERPYKCSAKGCEDIPGFTYSGGLLRHVRAVHNLHRGPQRQLHCPHTNCKRSCGKGFSRQENLDEHIRRVHPAPNVTA